MSEKLTNEDLPVTTVIIESLFLLYLSIESMIVLFVSFTLFLMTVVRTILQYWILENLTFRNKENIELAIVTMAILAVASPIDFIFFEYGNHTLITVLKFISVVPALIILNMKEPPRKIFFKPAKRKTKNDGSSENITKEEKEPLSNN